MVEHTLDPIQAQPASPAESGVRHISVEEYEEHYAHDRYEWAGGVLIKMSPVSGTHDLLTGYLYKLLDAYLTLRPLGVIRRDPFMMRVDATNSRREPDLQVILKTNAGQLTETAMVGPADICIEVVSAESVARDYGEKFKEYEQGGVREYWIIDPLRKLPFFYRVGNENVYTLVALDDQGNYQTPLLPDFRLHVPTLWQSDLPDFFAIGEAVQAMLRIP